MKIGLVGLGRFVRNSVLPAYKARGYRVVSACDPSADAIAVAEPSLGGLRTYASVEEMLEREEVDVIDINMPWDGEASEQRLEVIRRAAARRIHVQVAKPMAATLAQCEAMVSEAESAGILLAVNQNSRFAPAFYGAGVLIRAGAIGSVLSATLSWHAARGIQRDRRFQPLWDMTVHQVDVLLSWFDQEPSRVLAHATRRTDAGHVVSAILQFDDGSNAVVHDDYASVHRPAWPMYIVGELGTVEGADDIEIMEAGQPRMERSHLRFGSHRFPSSSLELPLAYRYAPEAYACPMGDLLLAIEEGGQPWADGRSVLRTMRTLEALRISIETGESVDPRALARSRPNGDGNAAGM